MFRTSIFNDPRPIGILTGSPQRRILIGVVRLVGQRGQRGQRGPRPTGSGQWRGRCWRYRLNVTTRRTRDGGSASVSMVSRGRRGESDL